MRCATCGTEIAGKALICFRCGAATTQRRREPARLVRRRRWPWVVLLAAALLGLISWLLFGAGWAERLRSPAPPPSEQMREDVGRAGVALAVAAGLRADAPGRSEPAAVSGFEAFDGLGQTPTPVPSVLSAVCE